MTERVMDTFRDVEESATYPTPSPEPTILDTLERCMQQAKVLEQQARGMYEEMMKTVFRVRGQQESRQNGGSDAPGAR